MQAKLESAELGRLTAVSRALRASLQCFKVGLRLDWIERASR